MDLRDQIDIYLNSSWKRGIDDTPYAGHQLVKFGEWSRTDGFVKKDSAMFKGDTYLAIPCPVIVFIETKIREKDLILTITGKTTALLNTEEFSQLGTKITKKLYRPTQTTTQTTLTIPRFTRTGGIFLLSGLGNNIYDISTVTSNQTEGSTIVGGKVSFYGLASEGSKIMYYLGMFNLHNTIKKIINGIWIAPTLCPTCEGIGSYLGDTCPQCKGYKYSGQNAERGIAIAKAYDVGITREKFPEIDYPLSDTNWNTVNKFINKAWTQKWHCTPTVTQIKKMFAHFYNVEVGEILITERNHFSMPHWDISLPIAGSVGSPFDTGDVDLMKFIAESVTPAGVNVFVGFYQLTWIGNLDELVDEDAAYLYNFQGYPMISMKYLESSIEQDFGLWRGRWRTWNGWCDCVDNFETDLSKWTESGVVSLFNANDIGRHWCKIEGSSYIQTETGYNISTATGVSEIWFHPKEDTLRFGAYLTGIDQWAFYVDFKGSGFYDHYNVLIREAINDCDYHVKIEFVADDYLGGQLGYISNIKINQDSVVTGIQFLNSMAPGRPIRIEKIGVGSGYVDNFGGTWVNGYTDNNNWQRLYPWGWGTNHADSLSGVINLYEDYFRKDKFFNIG